MSEVLLAAHAVSSVPEGETIGEDWRGAGIVKKSRCGDHSTFLIEEPPACTMTEPHQPCGGYRQGDVPYVVMTKYLSTAQIQLTPSECKFHFEGCKSPILPPVRLDMEEVLAILFTG